MRTRDIDKEQLVKQKAIETIVKHGLEGFTMNKLAIACNISVGTLYIYYKDKDDLIIKIVTEESNRMGRAMVVDFDPEGSFEDGLRIQWRNRFNYMMENPLLGQFFDQINSSSYHKQLSNKLVSNSDAFMREFKESISRFLSNVVKRGEIDEMPLEVYWSVAYAPLYSLIRFHHQGYSLSGKPFKITEDVLWDAFDRVVKAFKN